MAAGLALAAGALDAADWVAVDVDGVAGVVVDSEDSMTVDVATPAVGAGVVVAAFDFVDGLHAADANATIAMAAAVDSTRTCMAAPRSDDCDVSARDSRHIEARCATSPWNRGKPSIRARRPRAGRTLAARPLHLPP